MSASVVPRVVPGRCYASNRTGVTLEICAVPLPVDESYGAGDPSAGDLVIQRLLRPGDGFALFHVHLDFDETWEVVCGVADARIGRRRLRLGKGERFEIPRNDVHVNPRNRSHRDVVLRQIFSPGTRDAQRYVEALAECLEDGRDVRGDLSPLRAMALLPVRTPETYAAGLPHGAQRRAVFPAARRVQRWLDERRLVAEEERKAAEYAAYGYWAEETPRRRRSAGRSATDR